MIDIRTSGVRDYLKRMFRNKIASNFFYLSLLQVANAALPFVTLPYLVSTVGFDKVGIVFMAQALMSYLIIITDYGFNLTATRFISVNRLSPKKIQYIHSAVVSTKSFLVLISFCILLLLTFVVPLFREEQMLFLFSFTMVLGNTFFPTWFFQGIEEMKYISLINFINKILFTIAIFVFVTRKQDYVKINCLSGISGMVSTVIAFAILRNKYAVQSRIAKRYIKAQLNEGWHIFVSNLAVNVYMYSNIFMLGLFANKTILGYFGVADKCIQGVRQVLIVFYQVTYPKACHVAEQSHSLLLKFYRQVFSKFLFLIFFGSAMILALAPFIVFVLTKSYQPEVTSLLRCMSFIPFIVALNIPYNQSAVIYKLKKGYSVTILAGTIINVFFNILLAKRFSAYGTVATIYTTEIFITASLYLLLRYNSDGRYSLKKVFLPL